MRSPQISALRIAVIFASFAIAAAFPNSSFATTSIPPKDSSSSCALSDYTAAEKALAETGGSANQSSSSVVSEPEVVLGTAPLNTAQQIVMGRQVTVCVKGLYNWIYVQKHLPTDLHLLVGGEKFTSKSMSATLGPPGQEYVNFTMRIDSPESPDWKAWANIVDASRHSSLNTLSISIYTSAQVFESTAVTTVPPFPDKWPWLLLAFIVLLAILLGMAWKTPLLRYTADSVAADKSKAPFSLGSAQMAWWFYLALAAYVYICVSTLQIHIAMGSVLGLLGISATTGLAAVAVDAGKSSRANTQKQSLQAEQTALQSRIAEMSVIPPADGSALQAELINKSSRLAQVDALVDQLPEPTPSATSKGFFTDILSDGDGISFHRFQITVWTVVLGSVFVWGVYRNMAMPDFDPSLLTLMGISSGTYVGFKIPEPKKA